MPVVETVPFFRGPASCGVVDTVAHVQEPHGQRESQWNNGRQRDAACMCQEARPQGSDAGCVQADQVPKPERAHCNRCARKR